MLILSESVYNVSANYINPTLHSLYILYMFAHVCLTSILAANFIDCAEQWFFLSEKKKKN